MGNESSSAERMQVARQVNLNDSDSREVLLLADVASYYRYVRVAITECASSGMDCRVHGLRFIGRIRNSRGSDREDNGACYPFLAADTSITEDDDEDHCPSSASEDPTADVIGDSVDKFKCTVYTWGLNDKGQLGMPGELKVKYPAFNPSLSRLDVMQIVGGSKSLFVVTRDGKLYASGDSSNGRLGLGDILEGQLVTSPTLVSSVTNHVIKKVAVSCGGKHSLALTSEGNVFSWGDNTDGKLGHNNRVSCYTPKLIEAFWGERIKDICCGSGHSAAINVQGALYTWGLGEYGRLGHGATTQSILKPKKVQFLQHCRVAQVGAGPYVLATKNCANFF